MSEESSREEPLGRESQFANVVVIPHYWGTTARMFMVGAVALMLLSWPLYGTDGAHPNVALIIAGALLAVAFAALTNPRVRWVSIVDAIIAAVGAAAFAAWAIAGNDSGDSLAFILRIVVALLFLAAFYYSLKTVRAFSLHEVGQPETEADLEALTQEEAEESFDHEQKADPDYPHHHSHSGNLEL